METMSPGGLRSEEGGGRNALYIPLSLSPYLPTPGRSFGHGGNPLNPGGYTQNGTFSEFCILSRHLDRFCSSKRPRGPRGPPELPNDKKTAAPRLLDRLLWYLISISSPPNKAKMGRFIRYFQR